MPTIYRKTVKGSTEIETRAHRLAPRARSALIVVDGRRDAEALKALIPQQAEEILALLLAQGFIEAAGESEPAPAAAGAAPSAAPRQEAPPPAPGSDFAARQRAAVRELNDMLGPRAESLAIRMERARDVGELRPLLLLAQQVIESARGRAAAEAYAARHTM